MPKASVIIPAYNAMTYLPATLESVLRQTFTDFEVLIINDGSSDGIVEWVSGLEDSRIRLISQDNQGSAGARNTGISHSTGEYIAFLDSDDLWEPTKLEKQVQCLEEYPEVGLVNTGMIKIDPQGNPIGEVGIADAQGNVWQQIAEENIVFCGSAPLVRRHCFERLGVFDRELRSAEDWDMWIRIASCYQFAELKEPLVFYRQHPNNKSKNLQFHLQHRVKVIEKTFKNAPVELLYLKQRALGRAHLSVAWKPLQTNDYQTVMQLCRQAITYYPRLRFTEGYLRLMAIIITRRWLGNSGYKKLKNFVSFFYKNPQTK